MPIQDRDYTRGSHPPNCSCLDCTNRRLRSLKKGTRRNSSVGRKASGISPWCPDWLKALLLVFAASMVGLTISAYAKSYVPFWPVFIFSIFYSIEKWFHYLTRRHRVLGKLYRLLMNLSLLALLGLLIWLAVKLFSHQLAQDPLVGSLMLLAGFVLFVWMCKAVARNSWRWPSMKLTVFSLICLFFVFSFAGVQPLSDYKDILFTSTSDYLRSDESSPATPSQPDQTYALVVNVSPATGGSVSPTGGEYTSGSRVTLTANPATGYIFDRWTGHASGTSPNTVITMSSTAHITAHFREAPPPLRNPSWAQLKDFLYEDDTDKMAYVYPTTVCHHFASRLQQNAQAAGWRCAYVVVELEGYPDWHGYGIPSRTSHALNAFETTDRGLVFIDCTSAPGFRGNADKIVDVKVGGQYIPKSIFPEPGWSSTWGNMGTIVDVEIRW